MKTRQEILKQIQFVIKNQLWGLNIEIMPDMFGVDDVCIIKYMPENRCNYYNRDLKEANYTQSDIENALVHITKKAQNAFANGEKPWIKSIPLTLGYVEEMNMLVGTDGYSRHGAILYLNERAEKEGRPIPYPTIPARIEFFKTYDEAVEAMCIMNDTCMAGKKTTQCWDVPNKRRFMAITERSKYAPDLKAVMEFQNTLPSYCNPRTSEIINYGFSKISDFKADSVCEFNKIARILATYIFNPDMVKPLEIERSDKTDSEKKVVIEEKEEWAPKRVRYASMFDFSMIISMLARDIHEWNTKYAPQKYLNKINDEVIKKIGLGIYKYLFGEEQFEKVDNIKKIMDNKNRSQKYFTLVKDIIHEYLADHVSKHFRNFVIDRRNFIKKWEQKHENND